jgi:hypothetical protein
VFYFFLREGPAGEPLPAAFGPRRQLLDRGIWKTGAEGMIEELRDRVHDLEQKIHQIRGYL